ncbi:hypothetical protein HBH1_03902 [Herbaspirillum sp. BH-1]|uniref:AbiTii domain-containing protein n=1 Tax=Herbaspirillum sp. (strain BH-1) TaxID=2058884 RepID=UPI000C88CB3D|nr:hypothetical protein [Herbaspirillum sp. BH-1]PLY57872.1 hypothetical protein HBH1_03902 [Herbaspirillum sp. BH-1]
MKLVDETIEMLTSAQPDLENALFKSQVLAHKLGEPDFGTWVKSELVGYPIGTEVPQYRRVSLTPYGNISNGFVIHQNMRLPTRGLSVELRDKFFVRKLRDSIAVIRDWGKVENLSISFSPETFGIFKGLERGHYIERAWGIYGEGAMTQVLVEVRSRLLDFLLNLADRFPAEPEPSAIKELSKELGVNELFKGAIFGNGAVLNVAVGNNNVATQTATVTITQGDFESLAKELKAAKVQEPDIQELRQAIEFDKNSEEIATGNVGPEVRGWLNTMLTKAGTAGWDFSMQTGAAVLAAAIGKYYGFN